MIRFVALLLTVLTGFSGLVYEVAWQKYLATLLGSDSEATAAVLAIFLGGLSVGYALFGRVSRRLADRARVAGRPPRLLRFYGAVEAGIGVYALAFPLLFGAAQWCSLFVPLEAGVAFAFDVVLTTLLIGPPAVLMGGTIPLLTLALAGDVEHSTRVHAWVYGFNTVGAFAGALAGGFVLIPLLGLDGVVVAMGGINLVAGSIFVLLDPLGERVVPDLAEESHGAGPVASFSSYAAIVCLSGFAMMALQTTFNRLGGLSFGASHYTFAMVVAVFVLCIALGSLAVSALSRIPPGLIVGSQWLLVLLLALLYFEAENVVYRAHVLRVVFARIDQAFYPFHVAAFGSILAGLLLPIGLAGALLPLLFHHLRREVGDLGAVAGRLYSWNTVGSLLGAVLGGYVLLFWLDLHQVYRIALGALVVAASLLTVRVLRAPALVGWLCGVVLLGGIALMPGWNPDKLSTGLFRRREPIANTFRGPDAAVRPPKVRMIFHTDDPTSSVYVTDSPPSHGKVNRSLITNGKPDGNLITDYPTMALAALIPALMTPNPERAFVIGYGTGVTAGEFAALESVRVVRVAEISQGVIDAAPLFDPGNLRASRNPKVTIERRDAYRALLRSEGRWDVIASEPSNPWVTGVEMLYSIEFLEAAKSRLAPGGVYAQWFHLYEADTETVELVFRNYAHVFSDIAVWWAQGPDLLLLGFENPEGALDVAALRSRFEQPDFRAGFARVGIDRFAALLAHEVLPLGVLDARWLEGPLHTLRHPILSHMAARAFFRGRTASMPKLVHPDAVEVGTRNSLLQRHARGGEWTEEDLAAAAVESCRLFRRTECPTVLAHWQQGRPDSVLLQETLAMTRSGDLEGATRWLGSVVSVEPSNIDALARLYRADPGRQAVSVEAAQRATERYVSHFHYAFPFEREVLESLWERCTGEECEAARRQAEARVGRLGRPPVRRADSRRP